jgi:two-component system response regulator NreC
MSIKILLADDHNLVRQGLRSLLEQKGFTIAGEASDGQEAVRLARELRPDVAVLDIGMRPVNGIDAAREILRDLPKIKVILLTMYTDESYVLEALQAGVTGYCSVS